MDFYFHFVVPNRSLIELGRSAFVTDVIRSQFSRYVSAWWEKLCRQAVSGGVIDGEMYNLAGRWWATCRETKLSNWMSWRKVWTEKNCWSGNVNGRKGKMRTSSSTN